MTSRPAAKDLVVLTADKNAQFALRGILSRTRSLRIRPPNADFFVHPEKDPGVFRKCHDFLRPFVNTHWHALVIMDQEGSGLTLSRADMESEIEKNLRACGWEDRAAAVVIEPELDLWVWSDSPHVDTELSWVNRQPGLRTWLRQQGFLSEAALKPSRPKEALEAALREVRMPRSSAIYEALASKVSLARCTDAAFAKLITVLQSWFAL